MRARQLSFLPKVPLEHGGQIRRGKRKTARPIDLKRPLHLVLRSSMARGRRSMLAPAYERRVRAVVDAASKKYGVRVHRFVNVGNHLHLLVQTRTRRAFQGFLREIAGAVAMLITGARKSHALGSRFWDLLAYTRVVSWGRDFSRLKLYFIKNHFEAAGLMSWRDLKAGARVISLRSLPTARATAPPRGIP